MDIGRKQAHPVGGVHRHADNLNSEPRVVVGNEGILEEADSCRDASRNSSRNGCHSGGGHLEDPEVDEVPFGEIGSKPASAIQLVRFPNCHGCPEASGLGNLTSISLLKGHFHLAVASSSLG